MKKVEVSKINCSDYPYSIKVSNSHLTREELETLKNDIENILNAKVSENSVPLEYFEYNNVILKDIKTASDLEKYVEDAKKIANTVELSSEYKKVKNQELLKYLNKWYYYRGCEEGCIYSFITNLWFKDGEYLYSGITIELSCGNGRITGVYIYNNNYAPQPFDYVDIITTKEKLIELLSTPYDYNDEGWMDTLFNTFDVYNDCRNYYYRFKDEIQEDCDRYNFEYEGNTF